MTAEEPLDTSSRDKSVRKEDLMMKTRLGAPAPSRLWCDGGASVAAESRAGGMRACNWRSRETAW